MKRPVSPCECGDHSWLVLTKGFVALVDNEFSKAVGLWNWAAHSDGRAWYPSRSYNQWVDGKRKTLTIRLHQMILPAPFGFVTDHKNGNPLDNRRDNLRLATTSENAVNKRSSSPGSSIYRGVVNRSGKWRALITVDSKQIWLGFFDDEVEAAKAYDTAAMRFHGVFAKLNFPIETEVAA